MQKAYKDLTAEDIEYIKHVYYSERTHKEKTDILSNKFKSLASKPTVNLRLTLYPDFRAESLLIESPQLPSPSTNPVINQGSKLSVDTLFIVE